MSSATSPRPPGLPVGLCRAGLAPRSPSAETSVLGRPPKPRLRIPPPSPVRQAPGQNRQQLVEVPSHAHGHLLHVHVPIAIDDLAEVLAAGLVHDPDDQLGNPHLFVEHGLDSTHGSTVYPEPGAILLGFFKVVRKQYLHRSTAPTPDARAAVETLRNCSGLTQRT